MRDESDEIAGYADAGGHHPDSLADEESDSDSPAAPLVFEEDNNIWYGLEEPLDYDESLNKNMENITRIFDSELMAFVYRLPREVPLF